MSDGDIQRDAMLDGLPHRAPFRFIDRIDEVRDDGAIGTWVVRGDEAFLRGHFPGHPLVPGVLITEAAAQLGGMHAGRAATSQRGMLVMQDSRYKRPVSPPAEISIEVTAAGELGSIHRYDFVATSEQATVAIGQVAVSLIERASDGEDADGG